MTVLLKLRLWEAGNMGPSRADPGRLINEECAGVSIMGRWACISRTSRP